MKVDEQPLLPIASDPALRIALDRWMRVAALKLNRIGAGSYSGFDNAQTAAPTAGTWVKGDYVMNSNPAEAGSAGSKYVIRGWICTVGGTPGTWLQCRTLTGN
jgi:hypothetical protein